VLENQHHHRHQHHHHHHHHDSKLRTLEADLVGPYRRAFQHVLLFLFTSSPTQLELNSESGGRVCLSLPCFPAFRSQHTLRALYTLLCFALRYWCGVLTLRLYVTSKLTAYCSHSSRAHLRVRTHLVSQRSKLATCRSGSQLSGGYVCSPACLPAHSTEQLCLGTSRK